MIRFRSPRGLPAVGLLACGLLAVGSLLAGCGATTEPAGPAEAIGPAVVASSSTPSATALMVCGEDIRNKVRQALALASPPVTSNSFADGRYSCTYRLPPGPLVLSVQQSASPAAANRFFATERARLGGDTLPGLGEAAFGTGSGTVLVVKDSETLTVNATGLPVVFGGQRQQRNDLAYEIASAVLGCWTGDGDE